MKSAQQQMQEHNETMEVAKQIAAGTMLGVSAGGAAYLADIAFFFASLLRIRLEQIAYMEEHNGEMVPEELQKKAEEAMQDLETKIIATYGQQQIFDAEKVLNAFKNMQAMLKANASNTKH